MPKSPLLLVAPAVLGLGVLVWAARGGAPPETAERPRPGPRPAVSKVTAPSPGEGADSRVGLAAAGGVPLSPGAAPVSPETAMIQERLQKMEKHLRDLEARRDDLAASNRELERQTAEKWAELSARSIAEARVRSWERLLGLTETQKRSLIELCTQWGRQDQGRPGDPAAWLARELDLRSLLTAEQAAKLSEQSAQTAQMLWLNLGHSLGSVVGAGKDEQARIQQTLGEFHPSADLLLPEAHGVDWNGLMHEATARVRPTLTPEQTARLDRMGWK